MRIWIAGLIGAGAVFATNVYAADLYRTDTGPGGADFSGVSLGLDVGASIGANGSTNTSGVAAGGHLGYSLQNGPVVGGVEADAIFGNIRGGSSGAATFNENFLTSTRVKGGYAFGNLLGYGTVGWAWSTSSYQDFSGSSDKTLRGLAFGVGAEYAITRSVSLRAELMRYDFGGATYVLPTGGHSLSTSANMLRLGFSTHF